MPRIINPDIAATTLEMNTASAAPLKGNVGLTPVTTSGYFIPGTDLDDVLYGTNDIDTMHGYRGHDFLSGAGGDDRLFGEEGNDSLYGGVGNDTLDGGADEDVLNGGAGADTLNGGEGFDTASYAGSAYGVYLEVATGGKTNDAQGDTYNSIEKFVGSSWADFMFGDDNHNVFDGGAGDDSLFGNGGIDRLNGGDGLDILNGGFGDDVLNGGRGADKLTGGDGFDTFVFTKGDRGDTVTDFNVLFDRIELSGFGNTPFGSDGRLATAGRDSDGRIIAWNLDATDKVLYDTYTDNLIELTDYLIQYFQDDEAGQGGLHQSEYTIAHFDNNPYLTATDFLIV